MKIRALDAAGDFSFGQGLGSYRRDEAAVEQDLACSLRLRRGECFFAPAAGVDYKNLMEKGRQAQLVQAIGQAVVQVQGVVKVFSVTPTFNPRTRALSTVVTAQSVFSKSFQTQVQDVFGAPPNA